MNKSLKSIIAISFVPLVVLAIESINPKTVCDRFVNPDDQKYCHTKIEKLNADSYLTGVCQKQFDDDAFWDCMELGQVASFDPKKIDHCSVTELSDQQRLTCLKESANFSTHPSAIFEPMKNNRNVRQPANQSKDNN